MSKKLAALLLSAVVGVVAGNAVAADGQWKKDHPRRAEVNGRLANQDKRIHNEVKDGQISKGQAANLHKEDHQVRQEERDMASQDKGHITKQEQNTLNKQENGISHQIGG